MVQKREEILIGSVVDFIKAYPIACAERFPTRSRQASAAVPDQGPGQGFIVGIRSVYMSDYVYQSAHRGFEEAYDDPAYATGKRENVLLVTKNILQSPFIVRWEDATVALDVSYHTPRAPREASTPTPSTPTPSTPSTPTLLGLGHVMEVLVQKSTPTLADGCKHEKVIAGPNCPARCGSYPTDVCAACGAWRMLSPLIGPWQSGPVLGLFDEH